MGETIKHVCPFIPTKNKPCLFVNRALLRLIMAIRFREPESVSEENRFFKGLTEDTKYVKFSGYVSEITCQELVPGVPSDIAYKEVYHYLNNGQFESELKSIIDKGNRGYAHINLFNAMLLSEDGHFFISWNDAIAKELISYTEPIKD